MITFIRPLFALSLVLSLCAGASAAQHAAMDPTQGTDTTPERPKSYVVQQGDTLWDIAERFLFAPWLWKEIWHSNPGIKNPDLIYPGDTVYLANIKGKLGLKLMRGATVKLTPHIRSTPIEKAIPAIPVDAIFQFLTRPSVVTDKGVGAPYVVAISDVRLRGSEGQNIYVRGELDPRQEAYNVVRLGETYTHTTTGEDLGREALWVAEARLVKLGVGDEPATLKVKQSKLEISAGDYLYPVIEDDSIQTFYPKAPEVKVDGGILAVLDGATQISQYNVVAIDQGADGGLKVGDVLQIDSIGSMVRDRFSGKAFDEVKLPDEKAASLMVFRTFPKISFALVMETTRPLHVGDRVRNPEMPE